MQRSFFAFDIPCRHLVPTGLPWGSNHWIYLVHLLECSRSSYLGRAMQVKLISAPTINVRFGGLEKVFISCVTGRKSSKKIKCVVLEVTYINHNDDSTNNFTTKLDLWIKYVTLDLETKIQCLLTNFTIAFVAYFLGWKAAYSTSNKKQHEEVASVSKPTCI